ncbi:MAG: AAA family ATPase [Pseudomonadota bacterium]
MPYRAPLKSIINVGGVLVTRLIFRRCPRWRVSTIKKLSHIIMRIEKLHLENIGVFDNLDLEFQTCQQKKAEIQIFTGKNGSGKSTLLYALAGALVGPFRQTEHLISQRFQNNNAFVEILFEGKPIINYSQKNTKKNSYFTNLPLITENKKYDYFSNTHIHHAYANLNRSHEKSIDELIAYFMQGENDTNSQHKGISFAAFAYSGNRSLNSLDALTTEELDFKPLDNCLSFLETTDSRQIIQTIATQKIKQAIELSLISIHSN